MKIKILLITALLNFAAPAHSQNATFPEKIVKALLSKGNPRMQKYEQNGSILWWITGLQKDIKVMVVSIPLLRPTIVSPSDRQWQVRFAEYLEQARNSREQNSGMATAQDLQKTVINNQVVLGQAVRYTGGMHGTVNSFENHIFAGTHAYGVIFYSKILSLKELQAISERLFKTTVARSESFLQKSHHAQNLLQHLFLQNAWGREVGRTPGVSPPVPRRVVDFAPPIVSAPSVGRLIEGVTNFYNRLSASIAPGLAGLSLLTANPTRSPFT
jgi:hypothetical protein